jgi:uncharacterized coiled-coil DUF342 family protein
MRRSDVSDRLREILCNYQDLSADLTEAVNLLDAERTEHAKEMAQLNQMVEELLGKRDALKQELTDLRNQLQICDTHCLNLQDVIRDLRKRIRELEVADLYRKLKPPVSRIITFPPD